MKKILIIISLFVISFTFLNAQNGSNAPEPISVHPDFRDVKNKKIRILNELFKKSATADTTFYIRADVLQSYSNVDTIDIIEVNFSNKYSGDTINIWVENDEWQDPITENDVESIRKELLDETPTGSIDTNKGIYANELDFIGNPPNIDGDDVLDVLMIDVRDGYESGDSKYIAGYFDPLDQYEDKGNYADIIYIDTDPAFVDQDEPPERVLSTVAHELQHLIHWNYDPGESSWVNESVSTLIPRILGLSKRRFSRFLYAPNRKLNAFDNSLKDYSKVALWSFYNYQRFGGEFIKNIVHSDKSSFEGYDEVIDANSEIQTSTMQIVEDWLIANIVNDTIPEDGVYSYQGASIPTEVDSNNKYSNFFEDYNYIEQKNNAASYIQFTNGENIDFTINNIDQGNLKLATVKHTRPPSINIEEFTGEMKSFSDSSFGTDYDTLSFVTLNTERNFYQDSLSLSYNVTGDEVGIGRDFAQIENFKLKQPYPNPFNSITNIRFQLPQKEDVRIDVYNLLGQKVETLVSRKMSVGQYEMQWDTGNLASGIYLIRLKAGNYIEVKRSVLLK